MPVSSTPAHKEPIKDERFKTLLGSENWNRLPAPVRRRFSKRIPAGASLAYQGQVSEMRMSVLGRLLALALRVIGAPLPYDRSSVGRAATVVVTDDPASGGQFWNRQYGRASGFPQMVSSSKRFAGPTGLEEYIGFGIGMSLRLHATDSALHFLSDGYFLKLGARRVKLPRWMCPGQLKITHEERGGGCFRFTLELRHRVLGELLYQAADFFDADVVGDVG